MYFFIDLKLNTDPRGADTGIFSIIAVAIVTNVKALFATGHETSTKALSIRFYLFTYGLCAAIIFWCYTGLLVSYFTAETEEQPISSFPDLEGKPNLKLVLSEGDSSSQPYVRAIQKYPKLKMAIEKNIVWRDNFEEIVDDFFREPAKQNLILMVEPMIFYYTIFNSKFGS